MSWLANPLVLLRVFERRTHLLQFNMLCYQHGVQNNARFVWTPGRGWHLMDCYYDDERCICEYALWNPHSVITVEPPAMVSKTEEDGENPPSYDDNFYEFEEDITPIHIDWTGRGLEAEDSFRDFREFLMTANDFKTLKTRFLDYVQKTKVLRFRWYVDKCCSFRMLLHEKCRIIDAVRNKVGFHLTDCPYSITLRHCQSDENHSEWASCHCDYALTEPFEYLLKKYNIRENIEPGSSMIIPHKYSERDETLLFLVVALTFDGFALIDSKGRLSAGEWNPDHTWTRTLKYEIEKLFRKDTRIHFYVPDNYTYRKMTFFLHNDSSYVQLVKAKDFKHCLMCRRPKCYGTMARVLFHEITGRVADNYSRCCSCTTNMTTY